jgi:hypothetical protein
MTAGFGGAADWIACHVLYRPPLGLYAQRDYALASKPSLGHLGASAAIARRFSQVRASAGFVRRLSSASRLRLGRQPAHITKSNPGRSGLGDRRGAARRSEIDRGFGGFLNADIGEYVVPVNADIGCIEVGFVDKPDPLFTSSASNPSAMSMTGGEPAVANAIFATGKPCARSSSTASICFGAANYSRSSPADAGAYRIDVTAPASAGKSGSG